METRWIEPEVLAQIYELVILGLAWALVAMAAFWGLVGLLMAWLEQRSRLRRPRMKPGRRASPSSEPVAADFELANLELSAEQSRSELAAV